MKNAIIIHGMTGKEEYFLEDTDSESNAHWIPWLQKKLLNNGILTQTPEMPEPFDPNYEKWKSVFEYFPIHKDTILIGHSVWWWFLGAVVV